MKAIENTSVISSNIDWSEVGPFGSKTYFSRTTARVCDNVLEAVGGTPLIRLNRYFAENHFKLYGKLEGLNPAGSIKDRPARIMLEHALRTGAINQGTVIIESSSGNMGIGLAQACRYHELRFICVIDERATETNVRVMRAYGAEIDVVRVPDPESGELLQARLKRVQELLAGIEGSFWPNQYANRKNSDSHYYNTMHEIALALGGRVDFLFVPTSTCGTLRGCREYALRHRLATKVVAVDAFGSVIFSDVRGKRMIPGLGAGFRPALCAPWLSDDCVHVSDIDCVIGCRSLMQREAIFAGGSSGGVLAAIDAYKERIPFGSTVVAILPDRGERYLETLYSDDWVRENVGNVDTL